MDTIEQVLSLPSHSEVLPSLPRVSALPGVSVHVCALGMQVRTGPGLIASTSLSPLFWTPFRGVGAKRIQSFNLSSLSPALIMTPSSFFFFPWFGSFDSFSLYPPPFIFLCLEIQSRVWETGRRSDAVPVPGGWRQEITGLLPGPGGGGQHSPWILRAGLVGCWAHSAPRARRAQPMGFVHSNSQTPSFSEKKTFLPVTTE